MEFKILRRETVLILVLLLFVAIPCILSLKDALADSVSISNENFHTKLSLDDEFKLFEQELEKGIAKKTAKSRQKRYVYLNTESLVNVGFLIVIPITIVLPAMTNLFNIWRRKRSVPSSFYSNYTIDNDPKRRTQTSKIASYFDLIHVSTTHSK